MQKVLITFITSFLLGALFCLFVQQNGELQLWKTSWKLELNSETPLDMTDFWGVYDILEKDYFSHKEVNKDELVRWAIAWMVDSLW